LVEFEMPDTEWDSLVLEPDVRETLGEPTGPDPGEPLAERFSIGGPVVRALVPGEPVLDGDAQAFVAAVGATSRFCVVDVACSFRPHADERFFSAWLQVSMSRADQQPAPAPIAWSMEPLQALDPVEISRTVRLGPNLKFLSAGEVDLDKKYTKNEYFIEGLYLLEQNPAWEFHQTSARQIRGSHLLRFVAQLPMGISVVGRLGLGAELGRRKFGINRPLPYTPKLPTRLENGFSLS
jgi:hypothetical protein